MTLSEQRIEQKLDKILEAIVTLTDELKSKKNKVENLNIIWDKQLSQPPCIGRPEIPLASGLYFELSYANGGHIAYVVEGGRKLKLADNYDEFEQGKRYCQDYLRLRKA